MNTDQIRKETYKPRQKIVPQYSVRKSCLFLRAGEVYRSLGRPKRPDIVRFDPTEFGHLLARLSLPVGRGASYRRDGALHSRCHPPITSATAMRMTGILTQAERKGQDRSVRPLR